MMTPLSGRNKENITGTSMTSSRIDAKPIRRNCEFRSAACTSPLSIRPHQPAPRAPELAGEPRPIVERERPTPQARVARDGVVAVDAAQDRTVELGRGEFLRVAEELVGAYACARRLAAHERRPGHGPDAGGGALRCGDQAAAIGSELRARDVSRWVFQGGDFAAGLGIPDARGAVE